NRQHLRHRVQHPAGTRRPRGRRFSGGTGRGTRQTPPLLLHQRGSLRRRPPTHPPPTHTLPHPLPSPPTPSSHRPPLTPTPPHPAACGPSGRTFTYGTARGPRHTPPLLPHHRRSLRRPPHPAPPPARPRRHRTPRHPHRGAHHLNRPPLPDTGLDPPHRRHRR